MNGADETIDRPKLSMSAPLPLREAINKYAKDRARKRKRQGLPVDPGDMKGAGRTMERVAAWLAWISEDDLEAIQAKGEELLGQIASATDRGRAEHGPDYEAPLPYSRRSGSVFAVAAAEGPVVRGDPLGNADVTPGRGRKPKRKPGHEDRNRLDRPAAAKRSH